ncbi:MAG: serine/threonine-protein kinase [bacterium]
MESIKNGQYRIIDTLGKGGQGTVYKAEDKSLPGHSVALKVIDFPGRSLEEIYADENFQHFRWEFMVTAKLKHPQIASAIDYGIDQENQVAFMARPYLDGYTLTELLNRVTSFSVGEGTRIILSIASVLDYLHSMAVVHCDIKPSNIFMEHDDPCLTDFGLAAGKEVTGIFTGGTTGTLSYLAPEVLNTETCEQFRFSPSRDWWGLGCVAFNIFTGRRLFTESDEQDIRAFILNGNEQDILKQALKLPKALSIVGALLERNPAKRVSSKAQLEKIACNENSSR